MTKSPCCELSELAKGQEENPAFVWSIASWEMPLTLGKDEMQLRRLNSNTALSSRGCEDLGLSPERGSKWRQFHRWWQNGTSTPWGSRRPEVQLQNCVDKHTVCPWASCLPPLSLDVSYSEYSEWVLSYRHNIEQNQIGLFPNNVLDSILLSQSHIVCTLKL